MVGRVGLGFRPTGAARNGPLAGLAFHAAGLLLALVLLVALGGPRTSVTSDEGAGIHQAVMLQRGGWLVRPTLPELDPLLVQQPFLNADAGPKGRAPYAKHPAYPLLLELARRGRPSHGLMVPGVLGTWVAAVAAALMARALRAAATVPTLWLAGLGSPLTIEAQLVLAHAPAAGTAGVAALAAGVVLAPEAFGRKAAGPWVAVAATLILGLAAAATVLLRSEGSLLVGGLVLGALVAGVPWRRSAAAAAALTIGAATARALEIVSVRSIVGAAAAAPAPAPTRSSFLAGRIQAFQASWFDATTNGHPGGLFLALGVTALALAVVGMRLEADKRVVVGLVGLALGGTLAWLVVGNIGLVPGLLPATPWLVAGLALGRPNVLRAGLPRFLAVGSATAAGAILATQYSFGGGVEWGGRFYAVVIPVVAPLMVVALWPDSWRWRRTSATPIILGAVGVTGLVTLGGLIAVRSSHEAVVALADEVAAAARAAPPGRPDDPDQRTVVVGPQRLWPQLLWPHVDEYRWVTADEQRLPCALHGLQAAGFRRLVLLGPSADGLVALAEGQGWRPVEGPAGPRTRLVEAEPSLPVTPPTCPPGTGE